MCYFITATLPEKVSLTEIEPITAKYKRSGLSFAAVTNPFVQNQLPPNVKYYRATHSYCDCGTALGCARNEEEWIESDQKRLERKVKQFRSKGWSEAKIDRWLQQQEENKIKDEQERKEHQKDSGLTEQQWSDFLMEFLQHHRIDSVGILLHYYGKGDIDNDKIHIKEKRKIHQRDINPDVILHVQEDIFYEFVK